MARPKKKAVEVEAESAGANEVSTGNFYDQVFNDIMDKSEKDLQMASGLYEGDRVSTDHLMMDMVLGGGLCPTMYVISGPEGSAKTTETQTIIGGLVRNYNIPIIDLKDPENAVDADYTASIWRVNSITDIIGERHPKGKGWLIPPKVRYSDNNIFEKVFGNWQTILNALPDKLYDVRTKQWYLVFDRDRDETNRMKEMQKHGLSKHDKKLYTETGRYWCSVGEDDNFQAALFLDSIPQLLLDKIDTQESEGNDLGIEARAFSKYLKRIRGKLRRKRVLLWMVNQLREKPMARGCLHGDTSIPFVDGTSRTIREIVEYKIKGKVWSHNEETGRLEAKKIIGWHNNGKITDKKDWITIQAKTKDYGNGVASTTVTPDHEILTDSGWKRAKNLKDSDKLVSKYSTCPKEARSFLYAILSGDSCLVPDARSPNTSLRLCNNENPAYNAWKLEKLKSFMEFRNTYDGTTERNNIPFISNSSIAYYELEKLREKFNFNRDPSNILKYVDPLFIAVQVMDGGNFDRNYRYNVSYKRFKNNNKKLKNMAAMYNKFGIKCRIHVSSGSLSFNKLYSAKLSKLIAPYIHPSMKYKLPKKYHGKFVDFFFPTKRGVAKELIDIVSIVRGSDRKFRNKTKYDISIKDNTNYLAGGIRNGFIVHNSPWYEPCGNSVKFASDIRNELWPRAESSVPMGFKEEEASVLKKKKKDIYAYKHLRNSKNKKSKPKKTAWLRIWVSDHKGKGQGICPVYDTFQYLLTTHQLQGKRDKFTVSLKECKGIQFNWSVFKACILAFHLNNKELKATIKEGLGVKRLPDIRSICFSQIKSGEAFDLENEDGSEFDEEQEDLEGIE